MLKQGGQLSPQTITGRDCSHWVQPEMAKVKNLSMKGPAGNFEHALCAMDDIASPTCGFSCARNSVQNGKFTTDFKPLRFTSLSGARKGLTRPKVLGFLFSGVHANS
jgi:hypothetical protein